MSSQPEYYYLLQAYRERFEESEELSEEDAAIYDTLIRKKESNAVPVLVEKLEAYVKRSRPSLLPANELEAAVGWELGNILSFADSRHVKLLEKFIADHPKLTEEEKVAVEDMEPDEEDEKVVTETRAEILKKKLDEVRKRPAPEPKPEPPFRLGDKLVPIPEKTEEK